jgi:hypothetical protein
MKINDIVTETASAGASSAGGIASVAGSMNTMQKRNADGTAKNALDQDSLFGHAEKKSKKKKA